MFLVRKSINQCITFNQAVSQVLISIYPYPNLSQEAWDKITAYLLPSSALSAGDVFNFKYNLDERHLVLNDISY